MLFIQLHLNGQPWNVGFYTNTEAPLLLRTSNYGIDLAMKNNLSKFIIRYGYNSAKLFELGFGFGLTNFTVNPTGEIITISDDSQCDHGSPFPFKSIIRRFNTQGQAISTYTFNAGIFNNDTPLLILPDSGYIVIVDTTMLRFNKSHQFLLRKKISLNNTSWAGWINGRICITGLASGLPRIQNYDLNLNLMGDTSCPVLVSKEQVLTPSITILHGKDNQLYKLYGFNKFSPAFRINNKLIKDISLTHDSIVAILYNGSQRNKIAIGDTLGNLLWIYNANEPSTNFESIIINNNNLVYSNSQLASKYLYGLVANSSPSQVSLNFSKKNIPEPGNEDIRLVTISHDSIYCIASGFSGNYYTRVKYVVQNYGTKPLTSFQISSYSSYNIICGLYYETQKVLTNIPPNGTQTFTSNWFNNYVLASPDSPFLCPYNFKKCYYLTLPNNQTDINLQNNESCLNGVAMDLNETTLKDQVKFYPNPASDLVQISTPFPQFTLEIFDITGKPIKKETSSSSTYSLDLNTLETGFYFILLQYENQSVQEKIIVQH